WSSDVCSSDLQCSPRRSTGSGTRCVGRKSGHNESMAHDWRQSLLRWQAEGLLTARQAELILVFEQSRLRRRAASAPFRVLALLGGLCMTVGLGTLVAYNWAQIGAGVKLGALGLLLFSAAAVCVILRERAPH